MLFALALLVSISSSRPRTLSWWLFLFLVKCNVALSAKTVFGDPGLIPPVNRNEQEDGSGLQKPNPIVQQADHAYMDDFFSLVYCRTCRHLRPSECSHCKVCDVCIRGFDHHCVVLGCCIGERNIGTFIGYLYCVALSALHGTTIVLRIAADKESLAVTSMETLIIGFLVACGGATAVLVGGFACYYTFLVYKKKTSKSFLTASGVATASAAAGANKSMIQHLRNIVMPKASYIPMWFQYVEQNGNCERDEIEDAQ